MLCGTVLLIGHRVAALLAAKWDADRKMDLQIAHACAPNLILEKRKVEVLEREVAIKERQHRERPASEPMPLDLHNRITGWEEQHAQDDERATLVQLYAELGDWDKVRSKLPAIKADVSEPWAPV